MNEVSIIKDAMQKIEELVKSSVDVREVNGRAYLISDDTYSEIQPDVLPLPDLYKFSSLDGLVKMIRKEHKDIAEACGVPDVLYVNVTSPMSVDVSTCVDGFNRRAFLYHASYEFSRKWIGANWFEHEEAMIVLRSQFIQNEGTEYLLDFLARVSDENSVSSDDNGMTQTVQVKKGIALNAREPVKPIVTLKPYRTFLEVEQPESAFLIRVRDGMQVGIIEADGGMWKIAARRSVVEYLEKELKELIDSGNVVVSL